SRSFVFSKTSFVLSFFRRDLGAWAVPSSPPFRTPYTGPHPHPAGGAMGVRIGIDTGGTFTDLIGMDSASGALVVAKTPSTPAEPVLAIANALEASRVPPADVEFLTLGTSIANNA